MNPANKRLSQRIRVDFAVTIMAGRRELRGRACNMNLSGFFVALRHPLPVGELLRMRVYLPGDESGMDCLGWIRYCDAKRGSGIQMFAMSKEVRERWVAAYRRFKAADARTQQSVLPRLTLPAPAL